MVEPLIKSFPSIGCCGLDCGLCPKYHTVGGSKCPGCYGSGFLTKHPSCGYITCCVKKKKLKVCAQCNVFPCSRFESLNDGEYDSFLTYRKVSYNLAFIKEYGIEKFGEEQRKRINLLETMLKDFDDDRSKSFYCIATTLLPTDDLKASLNEAKQKIRADNIASNDIKARSKILKEFLNNYAAERGIELKLRRKVKANE